MARSVGRLLALQRETRKPLAVVLAGHNGSGKSTMWRRLLSPQIRVPLINADRMMMSVLPETGADGALVEWARLLRDTDENWMAVAQKGVQAFVGHAMRAQAPFAMETVFSHWIEQADGSVLSKLDLIREMQEAGYFVLLLFVGLTNVETSILRVSGRVAEHGHGVPLDKLRARFPRTRRAIAAASRVADATIFVDNSRDESQAFTVCRVQLSEQELYDIRSANAVIPSAITAWLDVVVPRSRPTAPRTA